MVMMMKTVQQNQKELGMTMALGSNGETWSLDSKGRSEQMGFK